MIQLNRNGYFGGKAAGGVPQKIINQIPPHRILTVGFAGLCAVTRYIKPAEFTYLYDMNADIIQTWQAATAENENFKVVKTDFVQTFKPNMHGEDEFIYLDPPYPHSCRKSKVRYKNEMSDEQHRYLIAKIRDTAAMVAISTYENKIYSELLSDWRLVKFNAMTRSGENAVEHLYMNYAEPTHLHDYRYLGDNFREREAINRRCTNFIKKLEQMEERERNRLLSFISETYIMNSSQNCAVTDRNA